MKVSIKNADVKVNEGISKRTGKPYSIKNQFGFVTVNGLSGSPVEKEIKIQLGDDQQPYSPGSYEIDESSFYVDNYGNLTLGRLHLTKARAVRAAS